MTCILPNGQTYKLLEKNYQAEPMHYKDNEFESTDSLSNTRLPIPAAFFYIIFTVISLGLVIWSIHLLSQSFTISVLLLLFVVSGMTYDNLVLLIGCWAKENPRLELLHRLRFLIHQLFIPTLIVAVVKIAQSTGIELLTTTIVDYGSWVVSLGLILFGTVSGNCFQSELKLVRSSGAIRYIPKDFSPLPAILTTAFVTITGLDFWLHSQSPWVLVGGLLVLIGNAVSNRFGGEVMNAAVELGLMGAILTTASMML
jgi:hypothetical protein